MARQGPKPKRGGQSQKATYPRIPIVFALGGTPTAEEKSQRRETVSRFMNDAKAGDVYRAGGGVGSAGAEFEVVERRGKLALKWADSNRQPVQMNRANVEDFIRNGATLVRNKPTTSNRTESELDRLRARVAKLPTTGAKVQEAYIDTLKYQHNIDLTGARDTYFDTRNYFNIDTRSFNPTQRAQFRNVAANVPFFDVDIRENGAYRYAIYVRKKK